MSDLTQYEEVSIPAAVAAPVAITAPARMTAFWKFGDAYSAASFVDSTGRGNTLSSYLRIATTTCRFRMGRNGSVLYPGQQVFGSLKGWGRWNRLLTAAEKTALLGKEYWPFATTVSLKDVKVYYLLDEAGGATTYSDATGRGNTLTATGATTQVAGPSVTDKATNFVNGVYLTNETPGTDLQSGQFTSTVVGWVKIDSKPTGSGSQQVFWGQLVNETPTSGINVYYDSLADRFCLDNDAGDSQSLSKGSFIVDTVFGSPVIGTWYLLIAEYDFVNNITTLSVNNGTANTLGPILQPTPVVGKLGNGSQFLANTTASFSARRSGWDQDGIIIPGACNLLMASNADNSIGNNSKTVWGWFQSTDTAWSSILCGINGNTLATMDWNISLQNNLLSFVFGRQSATASVAFTDTASWHLVVAWFDKTNNRIHLDLDHASASASAVGPITPQTVANNVFRFGCRSDLLVQFKGSLNAWGMANGIPTQADLDALWNNGLGWTL